MKFLIHVLALLSLTVCGWGQAQFVPKRLPQLLDVNNSLAVTAGQLFYSNGTDWRGLPPGTNGQWLTLSGGLPAWATLSTGLTIGTTTITSGTNGRVLYDNAGLVGELSLGSGVSTWWATPSSANLAAALTDETGSGAAVFATSPSLTTPTFNGLTTTGTNGINFGGTGTVAISAGAVTMQPATGSVLIDPQANTLTLRTHASGNDITLDAGNGGNGSVLLVSNGSGAVKVNGAAFSTTNGVTYTFPGTSQTVAGLGVAQTFTAAQNNSAASAASTPATTYSGAIFTGGTGTTTTPHLLIQPTGTTANTGWQTGGTGLGLNLNLTSGTTAAFLDCFLGTTQKATLFTNGQWYSSCYSLNGTSLTPYHGMGLSAGGVTFGFNGTTRGSMAAGGMILQAANGYGWSSTSNGDGTVAADLILNREAAATLQMGADAASPTAQKLKGPDGSGTDKNGGPITFAGGNGTGTGRGGFVGVQTSNTSTTGSTAQSYSERARWPAKFVDLTEASATTILNIAVAAGEYVGAQIVATVFAADATDFQTITSTLNVSAVNKAGTVTAQVTQVDGTAAVSAGTLTPVTYSWAASGNSVNIQCAATSSLTQTTLRCKISVPAINSNGAATLTEQ